MNPTSLLTRGTVDVIQQKSLLARLEAGEKLRVKLGIDPTKPDLHLGHAVPLRKLRQWQQAGHQVVLLFGGFTATIGDPTGKNDARPPLTLDQVEANAEEYLRQAGKILDLSTVEVVNNRTWYEPMSLTQMLQLLGQFTTAQMLERDMFQERQKSGAPIFCHEITYPILQGYDSVEIRADVEIGGTDQLFNLLAARPLQKFYGQRPQDVMTVPLIEGLDGTHKMSKSLGNYIGFDAAPEDMFGKIMRVPDGLMMKYFELLTDADLGEMKAMVEADPRGAKMHLGELIVTQFHDAGAAEGAKQHFVNMFVKKDASKDAPEFACPETVTGIDLVTKVTGFAKTTSEARRLFAQGAVSVNGEKIEDGTVEMTVKSGDLLKVGKRRFATLVVG